MNRVRIVDSADADGIVRDRAFADCEIIGPVQLVPLSTDTCVIDCEFPHSPDTLAQARAVGGPVLLLIACTFRRCRFALDVDAFRLQTAN